MELWSALIKRICFSILHFYVVNTGQMPLGTLQVQSAKTSTAGLLVLYLVLTKAQGIGLSSFQVQRSLRNRQYLNCAHQLTVD